MKKNKKILVVEDDKVLRTAIKKVLVSAWYSVLEATNGKEGVQAWLAHSPDLVVLDLLMPVMDGMTAFKKIRKDTSWGSTVPVIILTNLNPTAEQLVQDVIVQSPLFYLVKSDWKYMISLKK